MKTKLKHKIYWFLTYLWDRLYWWEWLQDRVADMRYSEWVYPFNNELD